MSMSLSTLSNILKSLVRKSQADIPALGCIRITDTDGYYTNLDEALTFRLPVQLVSNECDGVIRTIPIKSLDTINKILGDEKPAGWTYTKTDMRYSSPKTKLVIPLPDYAEEYPRFYGREYIKGIGISDINDFLDRLESVQTCSGGTNVMGYHGVRFYFSESLLVMESTDGNRAYQSKMSLTKPFPDMPIEDRAWCMNTEFLATVKKLAKMADSMRINLFKNAVDFEFEIERSTVYYSAKRVEIDFPDVSEYIDGHNTESQLILRNIPELTNNLKTIVGLVDYPRGQFKDGIVESMSETRHGLSSIGKSIDCDWVGDTDKRLVINLKYALEYLQTLPKKPGKEYAVRVYNPVTCYPTYWTRPDRENDICVIMALSDE